MAPLSKESCAPCRAGDPRLTPEEVQALLADVPGWSTTEKDGVARLEKWFLFQDFAAALGFADRVGAMAEAQDHHPEILIAWGQARVSWWTHAVKGLHRNDFICAAKTDALRAR